MNGLTALREEHHRFNFYMNKAIKRYFSRYCEIYPDNFRNKALELHKTYLVVTVAKDVRRFVRIPDQSSRLRSFESISSKIRYWRTIGGAEVDFIIETGTGLLPVEVKFTAAKPTEPVAMRNFRAAYKEARKGIIILRDTLSNDGALVIPAYLLDFLTGWTD